MFRFNIGEHIDWDHEQDQNDECEYKSDETIDPIFREKR